MPSEGMAGSIVPSRLRHLGRVTLEAEYVRKLQAELAASRRFIESSILDLDNLVSPLEWMDAGFGGFGTWRFNRPVDRTMDRTHAPINYLNEQEWRLQIAMTRDLCVRNHLAIGFRDHITNFVGPMKVSFVLRGQSPGASASGPQSADGSGDAAVDPLVSQVQQFWDEWCEFNDWGDGEQDREEECRRRLMVEGEATIRLFRGDDNSNGLPYARHIEPECIRTPPGHSTMDEWGWGLLADIDDDENVKALWQCDPENVNDGFVVPVTEWVRVKANGDRTTRRGLSDFFAVGELLRKVAGLHDNMAHVARLQAAIAWWEKYPTATLSQLQNMVTLGQDYSRTKLPPNQNGSNISVNSYEAGTVVQTEQRDVLPGPVSQPNGFAQVEQMVMRGMGFRWGCPSYFSGDGADSFASVLVTGSPFVRMTEERQKKVKGFCCKVAMRAIEFAERTGRLPRGTSKRVRPIATAKPVVIADEQKKATTFASEFAIGVADPFEYMRSKGLDPKTVLANLASFKKQIATMGVSPAPAPAPEPKADVQAPVPAAEPKPSPPGSAGGDGSDSPTKGIFGSAAATAESLAERSVERWLTEKGFTGTDPHGHEWVNGKQVAKKKEPTAQGQGGGSGGDAKPAAAAGGSADKGKADALPELSDEEKKGVTDGIDKDVAEMPEGQRPAEGLVAKAKDLALTAVARAMLFVNRIAVTRTFALIGEAVDAILDSPLDMAKLGYNPNTSSGTANPQVLDPVKNATGISGHLVASIAAKVIAKAVFAAKKKMAGKPAGEADESAAAFDAWAEFISQLLAHLTEQFGIEGAPDKATVEAALRELMKGKA